MDEDRSTDDELLADMLTSPDPDVREQGWRIVLWRFGLPLKKYILALLTTRKMSGDLWEDIAQKTYSTAIELLAKDKHDGINIYPWLCRIAKNHIGNTYRREVTRLRRTVTWETDDDDIDDYSFAAKQLDEETPEGIMLRELVFQNQAQAFRQARSRLSKAERRMLDALVQHPDQSIGELAKRLGENPKTVRNKKSLLLKKLKHLVNYFQQHMTGGDIDD